MVNESNLPPRHVSPFFSDKQSSSHAHASPHSCTRLSKIAAQSISTPTTTHESFMQPEFPELSQTANPEHNSGQQIPSTQHGLQRSDDGGAGLLSSGSTAGGHGAEPATSAQSSEQVTADAAFAASLQQQLGNVWPDTRRRLSAEATLKTEISTPSPPSGGVRITEYENASTPSVRKKQGPEFEVIKKTRSPCDKRSAIQELPNGWLQLPCKCR